MESQILTGFEKLRTRIVLAQSVGISPDEVNMEIEGVDSIYGIHYKGYTLVTGFCKVPTIEEAREIIKKLYLCGVEMDFDEEMKFI